MLYSTISDGTVVSCDLISQLISLSNVNTKAKAEPLAASSAHPPLLMHNWLLWKEAREGKHPAIILTPASRNWNPLTINAWMIEVVLETPNVHNLSPPFVRAAWRRGSALWSGGYAWFLSSRSSREAAAYRLPCEPALFPSNKKERSFPSRQNTFNQKNTKVRRLEGEASLNKQKNKNSVSTKSKATRRTFYILIYHFHPLWWGMKWEPSPTDFFFWNAWWHHGYINVNLHHLLPSPQTKLIWNMRPSPAGVNKSSRKAIKSKVFEGPTLFRNYPSNCDDISDRTSVRWR